MAKQLGEKLNHLQINHLAIQELIHVVVQVRVTFSQLRFLVL